MTFFGVLHLHHIFMGEQDQKMSQAGLKPAPQHSMLGGGYLSLWTIIQKVVCQLSNSGLNKYE